MSGHIDSMTVRAYADKNLLRLATVKTFVVWRPRSRNTAGSDTIADVQYGLVSKH